jgi:hypothetical protein
MLHGVLFSITKYQKCKDRDFARFAIHFYPCKNVGFHHCPNFDIKFLGCYRAPFLITVQCFQTFLCVTFSGFGDQKCQVLVRTLLNAEQICE